MQTFLAKSVKKTYAKTKKKVILVKIRERKLLFPHNFQKGKDIAVKIISGEGQYFPFFCIAIFSNFFLSIFILSF